MTRKQRSKVRWTRNYIRTVDRDYERNVAEEWRVEHLIRDGHTAHCAQRQVWGDGECECSGISAVYDPYGWMEAAGPG